MKGFTYKEAGVDVEAGYEVVKRVKKLAKSTFSKNVIGGIGGFGGAYSIKGLGYKNPVLVSGADGVGTKIKLAFMMNKHDTVGIDLVAMNVDDVAACGARPLFFLDYIACHKVKPDLVEQLIKGMVEGCRQAGCALIGGETAEMSDLYAPDEYDLAGVAVGIVDKDKIVDGTKVKIGDAIIGLASSGLHSNGYTLARKIFFEAGKLAVDDHLDGLKESIGLELLKPTRIYSASILKILQKVKVKGVAHITGGGLPENVERIVPKGMGALIDSATWGVPRIFQVMQKFGRISKAEMFKAFNMGIGMALVVPVKDADKTIKLAKSIGEKAFLIGEIVKGKKEVIIV